MHSRTFYSPDQVHSITVERDGSWELRRSGFTIDNWIRKGGRGKNSHTSERRMKSVADHIFNKHGIQSYKDVTV